MLLQLHDNTTDLNYAAITVTPLYTATTLLLQLTAVTAVCTSLLIVERIETAEACFTADASGHYLHQAC